ncbi:MAG: hypothetical protein LBI10_08820 [Deltaproteobacteria bacterium]|jgi:hypothetical protein|nr:hypothetical protein [Deltaproteobacteria bacterium]
MENFFSSSSSASPLETYIADDFPKNFNRQISEDIANRLAEGYPPGQTKLYLTVFLAREGRSDVAQAVEDILRTKGFTILQKPNEDAVTIAWRIDKIDDRTWYLCVNLSSGYRFTKLYDSPDDNTLTSIGLLSQGMF